MNQTPRYTHRDDDFIFYPTNKVVGIIDDPSDASAALDELEAAGFPPEDVDVLTGEEGVHRIDVTGEQHGLLARIVRILDKAGDMEPEHLKRHEDEMRAGHFGIGVTAKELKAREQVHQILKSHNGHFINFYGPWAIKSLEP